MRLTLLAAKEALAHKAPPDELEYRLNRAIERVITHGKFLGSMQRVVFAAPYGNLTLPPRYKTVEGVKIDGIVRDIANGWFEFMPGQTNDSAYALDIVRDLGDGWAIMNDLPAAGTLSLVYTGAAQAVTIYGEDSTGLEVVLTLTDSTPVANPFATITRIHKELLPPSSPLSLAVIHTDSLNNVTTLAIMGGTESESYFHRYKIDRELNNAACQALAYCKLRHIEFTSDNDVLIISNLSALESALDGVQMLKENDTTLAATYFDDAVDILNRELQDSSALDDFPPIRIYYAPGCTPRLTSRY